MKAIDLVDKLTDLITKYNNADVYFVLNEEDISKYDLDYIKGTTLFDIRLDTKASPEAGFVSIKRRL